MTLSSIDVVALLPALLPLAGVVVVLVLDLVVPTQRRGPYAVALLSSVGAAAATIPGLRAAPGSVRSTFCLEQGWFGYGPALPPVADLPQQCLWQATALSSSLQLVAALAAAACIALAWPRPGASRPTPSVSATSEPVEAVLLLTALAGTIVVAASRDVATWLIALELATLPIVVLVVLRGTRAAVAGGVQLLLTSLVSFALLVLGAALWLVATGSPFLTAEAALRGGEGLGADPVGAAAQAWPAGSGMLLSLAVVVLLAGIGFKLSLVPFHAWTPTAYAGASTPIATFLATVSKIGALAALLVVLQALSALGRPALTAIAVLSVVTMTFGNVMALRQTDVVRLLAWSTVAQAGWVIMPLVSVSAAGARAAATYLVTYVVATLVAFAVVARSLEEDPAGGRGLESFRGLWRRSPWRAGALALALTSLAGLPPGIFGLVGKIAALRPVIAEGWLWLALVAATNAVLGVAVYLRWLRPVISVPASEAGQDTALVGTGRGARLAVSIVLVAATLTLLAVSAQPDLLLGLLG